jgi:uncharacterized membrane protein YhaH (DUF805 family)
MTAAATTPPKRKKFRWWVYWLLLAMILFVMISPIIPVSIAENTARAHGCALNEGSATPCIVDGRDIGQDLYTMGMMGWLFLATAPFGVLALIVWLVVMIIHRILWGRAVKRLESPQ